MKISRYKTPLLLAFLLLSQVIGYAQQQKNITLKEAIELSLANSNDLKLDNAKINEAKAALREARERRLPDFKITGSYMRLNQPNVDLKINPSAAQSQGENGGNNSGASATSSITVDQAMYGMANLSLPIFTGFRIQNGIEAAKYLERAEQLDADKDKDEVIENTIAAYSNLYKAKAALDIVRENLKQSKQRVADFTSLEENGLLARNDLLKAQLQQSNVELSLLDAENNWKITYITMNLMLGLPEDVELVPSELKMNENISANTTYEEWESIALNNRKDIAAMDMRRSAALAGVKAAKGDYYPSLALTGGMIAAHVPNLLTISNAVNAGIGFSYSPSSIWKTGAKVDQAKARLQQTEVYQSQMNDAVRLQTAKAYQNYLLSVKKIEVYNKAVEQSNENYRIVKNKYDNSLATATDLLDADVAQLQAQLNYAFSKADAMVAYNHLLAVTGIINENI